MDDQVAVQSRIPNAFGRVGHQRPVGYGEVVVVNEFLTFEAQFRHRCESCQYLDELCRLICLAETSDDHFAAFLDL